MLTRCACVLVAVLTWPLLGCTDCERDGCDALDEHAPARGTGLGGVVALQSDVVIDGCAECPSAEATLSVWRVDAPVTTAEGAVAVVVARDPDLGVDVSGRYQVALEPASYLVCVRPNCISVDVVADETVTVNVKRRDGPTSFFVSRPGLAGLEESFGFTVRY